ncbi:MAG: M23 family metallopeptidase [Candidatus Pacearchaeota archaeon]
MTRGFLEKEKTMASEAMKSDEIRDVDITINHPKNNTPSYDFVFYSLKDNVVKDFTLKSQTDTLSFEEMTIIKDNAEEKIRKYALEIRNFYNQKNDLKNSVKFLNPSLSTFEKVILEEPDIKIKDIAYKAQVFYSLKIGMEPAPLEFYYNKIRALEAKALQESTAKDLQRAFIKAVEETELEKAQKQQLQQLQLQKEKTVVQTKQITNVTPVVMPSVAEGVAPKIAKPYEHKLVKPYKPKVKTIKLRRRLIQPKFLSKSLEFKNVVMPALAALFLYMGGQGAFKLRMEYINYKTSKLQETALDFRTISKIKQVAKNLEGKIFYSTKKDESIIGPGEHILLEIVNYSKGRKKIEEVLGGVHFSVRKMKFPFSPPLNNWDFRKGGNDFGRKRRRITQYKKEIICQDTFKIETLVASDIVLKGPHSGCDYIAGDTIKAAAPGIAYVGWSPIGGYFVEIEHGKAEPLEGGLKFEIDGMTREEFEVYADSIKCIVGNKLTYRKPEFFYGKPFSTYYCHIRRSSKNPGGAFFVKSGDYVERGQPIALVGATGRATARHLHFMLVIGKTPVDPSWLISDNEKEMGNISGLYAVRDSIEKILDYRENLSKAEF